MKAGWYLCGVVVLAGAASPWVVPHVKATLGSKVDGVEPKAPPEEKKAARPTPVVAVPIKKGDVKLYLTGLGSVGAFNTVLVRTRVDGELVKVNFTEGQTVNEGDVIFEIDPRPFEVQLAQAKGALERDQAELKNAKLNLARFQEAQEAISQQQIDTQAALVAQIEGSIKTDEAAISAAQLQLTYAKIRAPITGKIGLRLVDKGNVVRANDPNGLIVITQVKPIAVFFSLPQDELPRIVTQKDGGAGLPVEVYDRDAKRKLAVGTLLTFDNQIDATTGTVRMKAVFSNEDGLLYPNQFVNARLLIETRQDAVIAPIAAIQRSPSSLYVYVVKADETVELRPVTVGPTEGDEAVVEKGLAPGEIVVTEGVDKLKPGAKVSFGKGKKNAS